MAKRYIAAVHVSADQRETKVILDNGDELVGIMSADIEVRVGAISTGTIEFAMFGDLLPDQGVDNG